MMNRIFKTILCLSAAAAVFTSCEEFQPVFTGKYDNPDAYTKVEMEANTTIAELKAMYSSGKPVRIEEDLVIKGQVISSDQSGNIYRTLYIQDETGGIEVKIGKTGLYNDYKRGQWIYVKCEGLTLGGYRGMVNLGYADPTGEYETSYIDVSYLINLHIFRGAFDEPVAPRELTESDLTNSAYYGTYVKISGLKYADAIFALCYINPDGDHKAYSTNCMFLDEEEGTWGVTTWAMSDTKFEEYLNAGNFDACEISGLGTTVGKIRAGEVYDDNGRQIVIKPSSYSVSQYFKMGSTSVQVRSSGYARFADTEIAQAIRDKSVSVDFTGILTIYDSDIQFTLLDLSGVVTK